MVSNALGIDCTKRSADYIQLYRGETTTLAESLEYIQKTAAFILTAMEKGELKCNHTLQHNKLGITPRAEVVAISAAVVLADQVDIEAAEDKAARPEPYDGSDPYDGGEPGNGGEPYDGNELRIGRADYSDRREDCIERLQARADKARSEAHAMHEQARSMAAAIPFGQPILIGHHSEKRNRNYRERIHNKFGKSFELADTAKHYEGRAAAAEGNAAISSDDPEALENLRE